MSYIKGQLVLSKQILNILPSALIFMDADGMIERINDEAIHELNLENTELKGKNISGILSLLRNHQSLIPELIEELKHEEKIIDFPKATFIKSELRNIRFIAEGRIASVFTKKKLSQIVLSFRNIEGELTQQHIINMALSLTKIYPWFYDMEKRKIIIDARWFKHFNIPTKDYTLTEEEFAACLHPDDRDILMNALTNQIAGNLNTEAFAYRLRHNDGTWEWFEVQSLYLEQIEGTPYRIIGACQSIQEHKNAEEKLMVARDKAEQSDKLKSAFLANMSHEIRTPLNAIVGFSNLLASGEIEMGGVEGREFVSIINKNCEQLLVLISDIIDMSKIESNSIEFKEQKQWFNHILSEIYQSQLLNIPQKIEFKLQLLEKDTEIMIDATRLKQVINNLINNAVKFTIYGSITLGCKAPCNGTIEIYVKDTGIGMPKEKLEHIFERFYKVDSFKPGAGLGLSICKTIIEHMQGEIIVTSIEGKGTNFAITIPTNQVST